MPTELAEELAGVNGQTLLMRARMRGAVIAPLAHVDVRAGRYVAEVGFEEPIGTERQAGIAFILRVPLGGIRAALARKPLL